MVEPYIDMINLKNEIKNKLVGTHYYVKDRDPIGFSFCIRSKHSENFLSIAFNGASIIWWQASESPSLLPQKTGWKEIRGYETADKIIEFVKTTMETPL